MLLLFYFIILHFAVKHCCSRRFCLENNWKRAFSLLLLFVLNVLKLVLKSVLIFLIDITLGKTRSSSALSLNKVGIPELEFVWQYNDMRWKTKLSILAAILLGFKLHFRLIEFTRFAETTSAHAELKWGFFFLCVFVVYGEHMVLPQKKHFYNETSPYNRVLRCGSWVETYILKYCVHSFD